MKANELLLWMSARRAGSWQQFRAAVEELHSPEDGSESNEAGSPASDEFQLHQRLRLDFSSLGHAEFFARDCEHGWRIAPPALATHPVSNGFRAVLCGARSPALLDRLHRAGEPFAAEVLSNLGVPDVVRFTDPDIGSLESLAIKSGIRFQPDAPLAILYHLPPCVPPTRQHPQSPFPEGAGWRIREFDPSAVRWRGSERQHLYAGRAGLFEFQLYDQWRYFLRWAGRTYEMTRAVTVYVLLRHYRRRLLRYDSATRTLSLPGACRPPRLLERALVLCSGFPPAFDPATSRLTYADVPPEIARFAAELLRQPLA
jgi:hypothetical protein